MDISVYLYPIYKRKLPILITLLVVMAVVGIVTLRSPKTYEAEIRMRIIPFDLGAPDYGSFVYFDRLTSTYADIIASDIVTDEVKAELNLEELPKFQIDTIPQTELMRLTVDDTDPFRAQQVANALAQGLIEQNKVKSSSDDGANASIQDRLDTLNTQIDTLAVQATQLSNQIPRDDARLSEVQRTLDTLRQNYTLLLSSANQATVAEIARENAVSIVAPAKQPTEPTGPDIKRNLLIAAVVGLAAGIALVFVLETLSPRVYSAEQLTTITQSHIVTRVPTMKKHFVNDVFMGDRISAEAFRRLRTALSPELGVSPLRFVLVTSATPGEGKTTTAANLALSLAYNGRSVLLVEGDMLQPSLHKRYYISNIAGLSTILQGQTKLEDSIQHLKNSSLHILPAGPSSGMSAELLGSDKFYILLDEAMQSYDIVIFDAPAILAASDAMIIAKQMSAVLWVVNRNKVDRKTLLFTQELIAQAGIRLFGVIDNRVGKDRQAHWARRYAPSKNNTQVTLKADSDPKVSPFVERAES